MLDPLDEFLGMRAELFDNEGRPDDRDDRHLRRPSYEQIRVEAIPDATMFHRDPALTRAAPLMKEFVKHEVAALLQVETGVSACGHPNANWAALYLAYVLSAERSMLGFYNRWGDLFFPICGFGDWIPSYLEMYLCFRELERRWEAFVDAVAWFVQRARPHSPSLGLIGMVDASHAKSPSAIYHACLNEDACTTAGSEGMYLRPSDTVEAERARAREADDEVADEGEEPERTRGGIVLLTRPSGRNVRYRELFSRGHRWLTLDLTSALRTYKRGDSWFGILTPTFYPFPVGLPALAVYPIPADVPEWYAWPRLHDLVCRVLGHSPAIVCVDRGSGFSPFYRFNTNRGIATVGPRRLRKGLDQDNRLTWRFAGGDVDEDGEPRCPGCGGQTRRHGRYMGDHRATAASLGLYFEEHGEPRIRFACIDPQDDACAGVHSIPCSRDFIWLTPLSRLDPLHDDIRFIHSNREGGFRYGRLRYTVAGKDNSSQLLRPGLEPQRLRLWASLVLDWFRLCLRHGWLDAKELPVKLNDATIIDLSGVGSERRASRIERRRQLGTDMPFGPLWERLERRREWRG
jgi:hypothetical protein